MSYNYEFHFGFKLEGTTPQIKFYDFSTTTWYEYTIPAGTYFLKHEDRTKNIISVINAIAADFADFAIASGSRQITIKYKVDTDYMQIIDTSDTNRDSEKLIHMLGLQDNDGDFTTVYGRNMLHGEYSNIPVHSWYTSGGILHDAYSPTGFQDFNSFVAKNAKGRTSALSSGFINRTRILLTSIPKNDVRVDDIYPQQTVLYTTDMGETWGPSFWTAYDPTITDNCFFWEYTDLEGNITYGTYYLLENITPNQCKPSMSASDAFWDIEIKTSCIPYVPQEKYIYFPYSSTNYAEAAAGLADWALTADLSIFLKIYVIDYQNYAYAVLAWQTSGGYNVFGLRAYNNRWQFVQGSTATSYDTIYLDTAAIATSRWSELFITREGTTGTNNLKYYLNGMYIGAYSTTKDITGATVPRLALFDSSFVSVNTFWGALGGVYVWDKVLTDEERALVFIGRPYDVNDAKIQLKCDYTGGVYLKNTADSGTIMTGVHPKCYGSFDWRAESSF